MGSLPATASMEREYAPHIVTRYVASIARVIHKLAIFHTLSACIFVVGVNPHNGTDLSPAKAPAGFDTGAVGAARLSSCLTAAQIKKLPLFSFSNPNPSSTPF